MVHKNWGAPAESPGPPSHPAHLLRPNVASGFLTCSPWVPSGRQLHLPSLPACVLLSRNAWWFPLVCVHFWAAQASEGSGGLLQILNALCSFCLQLMLLIMLPALVSEDMTETEQLAGT